MYGQKKIFHPQKVKKCIKLFGQKSQKFVMFPGVFFAENLSGATRGLELTPRKGFIPIRPLEPQKFLPAKKNSRIAQDFGTPGVFWSEIFSGPFWRAKMLPDKISAPTDLHPCMGKKFFSGPKMSKQSYSFFGQNRKNFVCSRGCFGLKFCQGQP